MTKQTNYPSCVYLLNLLLISNQVPRRGDKTRCQEVSIISKSRLKAFKNIQNDWSCVNGVSSLALAGNFKFRVAALFALSLSCSSVCRRRIRVWRICLWKERSGAHRSSTISSFCSCFLPCGHHHGMFSICDSIMLPGFGFTSLCSIDKLSHSRKHNLPFSLFDSLVRLYVPGFPLQFCLFVLVVVTMEVRLFCEAAS